MPDFKDRNLTFKQNLKKCLPGFSLTELLATFVVLVAVGLVLAQIQYVLLRDVPLTLNLCNEKDQLNSIVKKIAGDIENADKFPGILDDDQTENGQLMILTDEGLVSYVFKDRQLRRLVFDPANTSVLIDKYVYSPKHLIIEWEFLKSDDEASGVCLNYGIEYKYKGKTFRKFANSRVVYPKLFMISQAVNNHSDAKTQLTGGNMQEEGR